MGYWVRGLLGFAVMAGALAGLGWCIWQLTKTGTCASGGPYVSARQCPPGTGWLIGGTIASIPVFIAGGALFGSRGGRAVDPGLPDESKPLADPKPFSYRS
jgi:hypothetical protein